MRPDSRHGRRQTGPRLGNQCSGAALNHRCATEARLRCQNVVQEGRPHDELIQFQTFNKLIARERDRNRSMEEMQRELRKTELHDAANASPPIYYNVETQAKGEVVEARAQLTRPRRK